jgi:hypothetical protein
MFYVMIDEKSASACNTLADAIARCEVLAMREIFPASWWIADEDGDEVHNMGFWANGQQQRD